MIKESHSFKWSNYNIYLKVRKTQERGGEGVELCYLYLLFKLSPKSDRVQSLEQCSESNSSGYKKIREKDTKQLSWFLPQSGSSPVPLHFQGDFHYNPI
ncbi:hypothetical protein MtrunA17_Chr6g0467541 [Medicago truncatula]|uniref:Uncharacterized protein n=1 Tax=Medicago truncatula TaxID=3880 RepID=A0A396HFI2_MEDTR|nr:hypothetical protein MtrunA17_Chr6g0467541 [Medicago truncatula]